MESVIAQMKVLDALGTKKNMFTGDRASLDTWICFLRTEIGPELCNFFKKVWMVAMTKCEKMPVFSTGYGKSFSLKY